MAAAKTTTTTFRHSAESGGMSWQAALRRKPSQKHFDTSFIRDDHLAGKRWWQRVNGLNCVIVFGVPVMAAYGLWTTRQWVWQTVLFALAFYCCTALGITAGYHRLWSHKAYETTPACEVGLMLAGTGALQGSIKWWCLLHRAHHRWTDTEQDPYNAHRGFFYAHVGWLLLDSIRVREQVDINDLRSSRVVRWQHRHFPWLGPFMAFLFPALVCGLGWGDFRGGFYLAGFCRLLAVQHATWCINSVAHWFGERTFDDTISPRDSILTGLLTMGEGYHNFHHEFPADYRNGIHWWDYDPTKWLIWALCQLGLAWRLNKFPVNEISKGEVDMQQKRLDEKKTLIVYGVPVPELPRWTQAEFEGHAQRETHKGRLLVAISGVVHDVTEFVRRGRHPGGKRVVAALRGEDATEAFNGGVYNHTNAARNLMSHMRVAYIAAADDQ